MQTTSIKITAEELASSASMQRLLDEAPYLARCSSDKTACIMRPREYAVKWPYMQVNRKNMVSWLVFDIDHDNAYIWQDKDIPPPNLIVSNRTGRGCHLYYAIPPVCTSDKARSRPIQYMQEVRKAMAIALDSDLSYSGPVAKTPFHPWWKTTELHDKVYDLGELADYVEINQGNRWSKEPDFDSVAHSRHCTIFEATRFYAYSTVGQFRETSTYEKFISDIERYAFGQNNFISSGFDSNLSRSQVMATVRSIARWTWDVYTGGASCNRGIMRLDKSLPLTERQSMAAKRTHSERTSNTKKTILRACQRLHGRKKKITYTALATTCLLSRQTVAKYRSLIQEFIINNPISEDATIVPLKELLRPNQNVKLAIHQITAPQGDHEDLLLPQVSSIGSCDKDSKYDSS